MRNYKTTVDTSEKEKNSVGTLNHLIEVCKDGEKGFQEAVAGLENNPELHAICLQSSKERGQFARALQNEVRQLNGDPASSGTLAGALHRGWMDIKSAVTAKDEDAIVAECERGEDVAKEAFEIALQNYLPAQAEELVKRQYRRILESHNRFSALKKAAH
jgi:uncharacterized protein (TIGR02284 family)